MAAKKRSTPTPGDVQVSQGPFTPSGNPPQLNVGSNSEKPGTQLGAFAGSLPAVKVSSVISQGPVDPTQSTVPSIKAPNRQK